MCESEQAQSSLLRRTAAMRAANAASREWIGRRVWMAPALQAIFAIAMVCQHSRVSGLFVWRLPLAMMTFASRVPVG